MKKKPLGIDGQHIDKTDDAINGIETKKIDKIGDESKGTGKENRANRRERELRRKDRL